LCAHHPNADFQSFFHFVFLPIRQLPAERDKGEASCRVILKSKNLATQGAFEWLRDSPEQIKRAVIMGG